MTRGSWIHDDLSRHFDKCARCRSADPESARKKHEDPGLVSERDVPAETLARMCPEGRSIYRSYLQWLAEPDW
jgi:hypothetical protein